MSLRNPHSIDKFLTFEASNVSAGPKIVGIRKQLTTKNIMLTGGLGFIGSHTEVELINKGTSALFGS